MDLTRRVLGLRCVSFVFLVWPAIVGSGAVLDPEGLRALEQEFGSLSEARHFERFMRYLKPYIEPASQQPEAGEKTL